MCRTSGLLYTSTVLVKLSEYLGMLPGKNIEFIIVISIYVKKSKQKKPTFIPPPPKKKPPKKKKNQQKHPKTKTKPLNNKTSKHSGQGLD